MASLSSLQLTVHLTIGALLIKDLFLTTSIKAFFPFVKKKLFANFTVLRLNCIKTWFCVSGINDSQIIIFSSSHPLLFHLWQCDLVKDYS